MLTLRVLAVVALVALVAAGEAAAQHVGGPGIVGPNPTPLSCDGKKVGFHVDRAKAIIAKAYGADRILDPTPAKAHEKRTWREHKFCVFDRDRRRRIEHKVDAAKRGFARTFERYINPPGAEWLRLTRNCENGGSYGYGTNPIYGGAYQFDATAWAATAQPFKRITGIDPDPSRAAAPREQDIRAAILRSIQGSGAWPHCAPW